MLCIKTGQMNLHSIRLWLLRLKFLVYDNYIFFYVLTTKVLQISSSLRTGIVHFEVTTECNINKSTQGVQTSDKAVYYPHTASICDLESQNVAKF